MTRNFTGVAIAFAAAGPLTACSGRDNAGTTATDAAETTGPASDADTPPLEPAVPTPATDPAAGAPIPSTPPIAPPERENPSPATDAPPASTPR